MLILNELHSSVFVPLCDYYVFVAPLPLGHLKSPQHVLLSSLLVSREKLTVSPWLGGVMGLLSVKTTVTSSTAPCAPSPSSSVPVGSVSTVPSDAMEMQTARISPTRRTVKVSRLHRAWLSFFPINVQLFEIQSIALAQW